MRILHLANHESTNVGNGALISGLERILREDLGAPLEFVAEPWDDYTIPQPTRRFDASFIERCRDMDGLLVGAAVTLVSAQAYGGAGMRFNLPVEQWDEIKCPIVFYGLSYRHWPGEPYLHADRLRKAIAYATCHERCLFSVRNDGTHTWLSETLGIEVGSVHVVPDPAVFVSADPKRHPWARRKGVTVAVSLNDEDWRHRFREPLASPLARLQARFHPSRRARRGIEGAERRRRTLLEAIGRILDELADRYPLTVILCPHHREDLGIIHDFLSRCSSRLKYQLTMVNGLPRAEYAPEFYSLYRDVDLVLAMRVHAITPSIGLGTPTLALCSQHRMTEFMRDSGLEQYAVDVFADDFPDRLRVAIDRVLADPEQARRDIRRARDGLRARARDFNRKVGETFSGARP